METQTYNIKCSGCEKILGESSIENHTGFLCQTCDDEIKLTAALMEGKNYDASNLAAERPEKLKEIVKNAMFENSSAILSWNFGKEIEKAKGEVQASIKETLAEEIENESK
jgi:hypothetical protein